ncbi:hypothetical protein PR048_003234 [Dryococelus australis]|uniref:Uncharacterized protein n=1 Tax=Dryococelus australis TaxID=614101 RepID=A0ABQ9IN08_9NEOP|nr:hypothetical protein PR048_003234 [Dryococelus australis]
MWVCVSCAVEGDSLALPFLVRCALGWMLSFWESRECRQQRGLLASQTCSRLLEFPIRLATTQECSDETGWRLSPPRRITPVGEDSRWRPETLYILQHPSGRQSLTEAAWRVYASEVIYRGQEIAGRQARCSWLEWTRGCETDEVLQTRHLEKGPHVEANGIKNWRSDGLCMEPSTPSLLPGISGVRIEAILFINIRKVLLTVISVWCYFVMFEGIRLNDMDNLSAAETIIFWLHCKETGDVTGASCEIGVACWSCLIKEKEMHEPDMGGKFMGNGGSSFCLRNSFMMRSTSCSQYLRTRVYFTSICVSGIFSLTWRTKNTFLRGWWRPGRGGTILTTGFRAGMSGSPSSPGHDGGNTPKKICRQAASTSTIPTCENPGVNPHGMEPGSPWWEIEDFSQEDVPCFRGLFSISYRRNYYSHKGINISYQQLDEALGLPVRQFTPFLHEYNKARKLKTKYDKTLELHNRCAVDYKEEHMENMFLRKRLSQKTGMVNLIVVDEVEEGDDLGEAVAEGVELAEHVVLGEAEGCLAGQEGLALDDHVRVAVGLVQLDAVQQLGAHLAPLLRPDGLLAAARRVLLARLDHLVRDLHQPRPTFADVHPTQIGNKTTFLKGKETFRCEAQASSDWRSVVPALEALCRLTSLRVVLKASQNQSSDTHKTPYDRVKLCRERNIAIKASERVNVDHESILNLTSGHRVSRLTIDTSPFLLGSAPDPTGWGRPLGVASLWAPLTVKESTGPPPSTTIKIAHDSSLAWKADTPFNNKALGTPGSFQLLLTSVMSLPSSTTRSGKLLGVSYASSSNGASASQTKLESWRHEGGAWCGPADSLTVRGDPKAEFQRGSGATAPDGDCVLRAALHISPSAGRNLLPDFPCARKVRLVRAIKNGVQPRMRNRTQFVMVGGESSDDITTACWRRRCARTHRVVQVECVTAPLHGLDELGIVAGLVVAEGDLAVRVPPVLQQPRAGNLQAHQAHLNLRAQHLLHPLHEHTVIVEKQLTRCKMVYIALHSKHFMLSSTTFNMSHAGGTLNEEWNWLLKCCISQCCTDLVGLQVRYNLRELGASLLPVLQLVLRPTGIVLPSCLPPRRTGFRLPAASLLYFPHVGIVPDDDAGRRVFSWIFRFSRPCIPALLHTHLASP